MLKICFQLALFHLVRLVGQHHPGQAGCAKPLCHARVVLCGAVTGIHNQNAQVEKPLTGEKLLHQLAPAKLLTARDIGKAVTRQIDQHEPAVNAEVVDVNGFTGRIAHTGKVFAVE